MSKVINISSHANFSKPGEVKPVDQDPIRGLDGQFIENEFMGEFNEEKAVKKFLCEMGFVLYKNNVARFSGNEHQGSITTYTPTSFRNLLSACACYSFRTPNHEKCVRQTAVLFGRLGLSAIRAAFMWREVWARNKVA